MTSSNSLTAFQNSTSDWRYNMSAKRATLVTVAALFTFILVAAGIGSVGASDKQFITNDGYGIHASSR